MVTGEVHEYEIGELLCNYERNPGLHYLSDYMGRACGRDGKHWEPKE